MEDKELEMMENQEAMNEADLPEDGVEQPEKLDLKNGALLGLAVAGGIAIVSGGIALGKKGWNKVKKWKDDQAAKKADKDQNPDSTPEPETKDENPKKEKEKK